MKRTFSEGDLAICKFAYKRRQRSLPATFSAPTTARWADVMGWLRAVPLGANAEEAPPNLQHHEESKIPQHSIPTMEHRRLDTCRDRKMHTRKRSASPTKKPGEYRSILLCEAGVFIDCEFIPSPATPILDALTVPPELQSLVDGIAEAYCEECREGAMNGEGEGDWRANASVTVMGGLRRYKDFAKVLKINGSDRPWRTDLKPVRATTVNQRAVVPPPFTISPAAVEPKDAGMTTLDQSSSFSSSAGLVFNPYFDNRPVDLEYLNSDSLSHTSGYTLSTMSSNPESLSTPKPDICVGLDHRWFSPSQRSTLNCLGTDPHASTMGLHFPFLLFEAKGNAGLFGAQNQAAVGAACMLRILDLISYSDVVVWSVTTEGPIHELWSHYCNAEGTYQSVHMGLWRMTNVEQAKAFVEVMAKILLWGSTVYTQRILQALGRVQYL
jgi:hypothetical protein